MNQNDDNYAPTRIGWIPVLGTILAGLAVYMLGSWLANPQFGRSSNRIGADVLIYLVILVPAILVAIVTGRIVPRFRGIPISNLVLKAFWVAAVFLAILIFGGWYAGKEAQAQPVAEQSEEDFRNLEEAREALSKNGLDWNVEVQVAEIQRNLPIRNNEIEQIVGVNYMKNSRTQTWRHQMVVNWRELVAEMFSVSESVAAASLPASMQEQTINTACSVPLTRLFLTEGLIVRHDYYEMDGTLIFGTKAEKSDCK